MVLNDCMPLLIAEKGQIRKWVFMMVISLIVLTTTRIWASPQDSPPVIMALRVDTPLDVDGHLLEDAWQHAKVATGFLLSERTGRFSAKLKTRAMVLYNEHTLYVGFRCEEPNMNDLRETKTRRDSFVWLDDAVSVLLDTYADKRNC